MNLSPTTNLRYWASNPAWEQDIYLFFEALTFLLLPDPSDRRYCPRCKGHYWVIRTFTGNLADPTACYELTCGHITIDL